MEDDGTLHAATLTHCLKWAARQHNCTDIQSNAGSDSQHKEIAQATHNLAVSLHMH